MIGLFDDEQTNATVAKVAGSCASSLPEPEPIRTYFGGLVNQ